MTRSRLLAGASDLDRAVSALFDIHQMHLSDPQFRFGDGAPGTVYECTECGMKTLRDDECPACGGQNLEPITCGP